MIPEPDDREAFAAFLLRLRGKGVVAKSLIAAFEATPRRLFLPLQFQSAAWSEGMVPIECGEAIEGADYQAQILATLALEPSHRVLEIGTGSGYTAALMSRLAARIVTLERYKTLTELARQRFEQLGLTNVAVRQADGATGAAGDGPFDRIIVWAAYDAVPRGFVEQLSSGGQMIVPIGQEESEQGLMRLTKVGTRFEREDIGKTRMQMLKTGLPAKL